MAPRLAQRAELADARGPRDQSVHQMASSQRPIRVSGHALHLLELVSRTLDALDLKGKGL